MNTKLEKQIHKKAIEFCADYPDIDKRDSWEQFYAICAGYEGTNRANHDLHVVLSAFARSQNLNIDRYLDFCDQAIKAHWDKVYDILIECCGANEKDKGDFSCRMGKLHCDEYRFQGKLGFGGKLYFNSDRVYVDFYSEDSTPERQLMKETTNKRIQELGYLSAR